MISKLINSKILSTVLSVVISFFLVSLMVYSASTISTNISTDGTLTVSGNSTFGDAAADINLFTGTLQASTTALFTSGFTTYAGSVFNEDSADADFRVESDGFSNALVVDGGLNTVGVASTTPWGLFSVEAVQGTVNTNVPIFVVGDQGTSTPRLLVNSNGRVGIATSTPEQEIGMTGDLSIGSSATTTIILDSTAAVTGACLQMRGSNGTLYRAYLVATTTASEGVTASWHITTGSCQ